MRQLGNLPNPWQSTSYIPASVRFSKVVSFPLSSFSLTSYIPASFFEICRGILKTVRYRWRHGFINHNQNNTKRHLNKRNRKDRKDKLFSCGGCCRPTEYERERQHHHIKTTHWQWCQLIRTSDFWLAWDFFGGGFHFPFFLFFCFALNNKLWIKQTLQLMAAHTTGVAWDLPLHCGMH